MFSQNVRFSMISRIFTPFIITLSFLSIPLTAKTPDLTIENLNTQTLNPATAINGQKVKYIADWFETIKKKGIPNQGIAYVPTNKLSSCWQFKKGIPSGQKEPIFIHSCPRDNFKGRLIHGRTGHSFRCTNAWLKNSIINGTFVTFDYFFDGKDFDLGQGINIDALKKIYSEVINKNPQAPIIIAATCIGAKIALEFAVTHNPEHVKAMILESPFIDVKNVVYNLGKNYLNWFPFADTSNKASMIQSIIELYAPHCKETINLPHANLNKINPNIPLFIAHLKNDSMCSDEQMYQLVADLRKSGNTNIYLLVLQDTKTKHGHLNQKKEFSQAANAFLAEHNLPHDKQLAAEGKAILADAKYTAQASVADWKIVVSEKKG